MKLGTIGYGFIGKWMSEIFKDLGVDSVGFHDPNVPGSQKLSEVVKNADIIHVASPTNFHLVHGAIVHDSGKPCLFEKTFTTKPHELAQYEKFFFDKNWQVMAHFASPFMEHFDRAMDEIAKEPSDSEIQSVSIFGGFGGLQSWKTNPDESGGLNMEIGSHAVYASLFAGGGDESRVNSTRVEEVVGTGHDVFLQVLDKRWKLNSDSNHFIASAKHFLECLKTGKDFKVDRAIALMTAKKVMGKLLTKVM